LTARILILAADNLGNGELGVQGNAQVPTLAARLKAAGCAIVWLL
jgi:hypothetical protein